jgi:hypothetical protein
MVVSESFIEMIGAESTSDMVFITQKWCVGLGETQLGALPHPLYLLDNYLWIYGLRMSTSVFKAIS